MKNIENAVIIRRDPEPKGSPLPDILIYCIIENMMDAAWNALDFGYQSSGEMFAMKQRFNEKCWEASRVLYLSGIDNDQRWAISPVFENDYPLPDPGLEDLPIIFPVGVKYRGVTYSFDIEAYFNMPHQAYIPSAEKIYAKEVEFVRRNR